MTKRGRRSEEEEHVDLVAQSDAFLMALQIYERPPRSLQLREDVPTVYHPQTYRPSSGCSSASGWDVVTSEKERAAL